MGAYRCYVARTARNTAILELLEKTGELCCDRDEEAPRRYELALTDAQIARLTRCGVHVVRRTDLAAQARRRLGERAAPRRRGAGDDGDDALLTGFVDHYLDAAEVKARVQALAAAFPTLCQVTTLPHATHGYDGSEVALAGPDEVLMLRITTTPGTAAKPGLLLVCGTHAREWVNPLVAIEFAAQLLHNYDPSSADPEVQALTQIVGGCDIFIVPVMNPDGLNYSVYDAPLWRKNRRPNAGSPGCPGVDNNRNYGVFFGSTGGAAAPCADTYRGPSAFSEPENENIRHILETYPNIVIAVDSHSKGEKIFRPTATGGTYVASLPVDPLDEAIYQDLESAALAAIALVDGKTWLTGTTSNHAGTSDEYMFFAHRIFAFDFECAQSWQPPIADGLVSVQEVTAALRALAQKALALQVAPAAAASVVQCIDRTGSMVSLGHAEGARANARRLVDLMSIGDEAAVVSFADPAADPSVTPLDERAVVAWPLAAIDDAGDYAQIHAAIDGLSFGGWTSIGAGLKAAAEQLAGAAHTRSIVLLSDGFENRAPSAGEVLATMPGGIRVFTIALGGTADTPLLQSIATQTGGAFYLSPDPLQLHAIYNQLRTDVSDDDAVLNELVTGGAAAPSAVAARRDPSPGSPSWGHEAYVERNAQRLAVTVSWEGQRAPSRVVLLAPGGRQLRADDWGVSYHRGAGYVTITVARPAAGGWRVLPCDPPPAYAVAAFVRSAVRVTLPELRWDARGKRLSLGLQTRGAPAPALAGVGVLLPAGPLPDKDGRRWAQLVDGLPEAYTVALRARAPQGPCGGRHVAALRPIEVSKVSVVSPVVAPAHCHTTTVKPGAARRYQLAFAQPPSPGVHTLRVRLQGALPDGSPFVRQLLKTVVIGRPDQITGPAPR